MPARTFHITTFGCQMNVNDSDWLARSLTDLGYIEAAYADADIHILNTCSVRDKPENKVYTELGQIRLLAKANPQRDIMACVGGCVAQQVGEKLFARSKELRLVFGTDGIAATPAAIDMLAQNPGQKLALLDFSKEFTERDPKILSAPASPSAFVNIMQGCDNFCAYCIVPFVRGRQKSRAAAAILQECRSLLEHGRREITLLGQNVNSFGQDAQGDGSSFTDLLRQVAALPGLARLRFMTSHPKDMAPELIAAFADLPNLAPRLHLPLQSGSDRILKAMGRKYDLRRYMSLVRGLREARPDLQLSTDIIVGFPGEDEEDFEATLSAMQEADFAASFSFAYSDRPGARASQMPDKIPHKLALQRLARLQAWQDKNASRILEARTGSDTTVIIEGGSLKNEMPDNAVAHQSWHGKDPYGFSVNIAVPPERHIQAGDLVNVRITGTGRHTLKGELE